MSAEPLSSIPSPVMPAVDARQNLRWLFVLRNLMIVGEATPEDIAATVPEEYLLGDKSLLFSRDDTAFVMYGVAGNCFIAMGDPVGSPRHRTLYNRF